MKLVIKQGVKRDKQNPMKILEEMGKLDLRLKQKIMSGLQRVLKEKEQRGIQLGRQRGYL